MMNYLPGWGSSSSSSAQKEQQQGEQEKKDDTTTSSDLKEEDKQNWTLVPSPSQGTQLSSKPSSSALARFVPSRLKVYSVDMGNKATKAVASALVGNSLLTTTVGSQLTHCASLTGAAQIESLGLVALRIPLRGLVSLTGNGTKLARFATFVSEYAGNNAVAVQNIAKMSRGSQVLEIGAKGNIIGAIATAAVQESIAIAYYMHGEMPGQILKHQSVTIGISALSGVGGGTVGAAIGTLTFPGVGTALGSLLGSYTGAFVPFFMRGDGVSHQVNEDPDAPSRKIKTVEIPRTVSTLEMDEDWLEVVDCTTESYFRLGDAERECGGADASLSSTGSDDPNLPQNTPSSSATRGRSNSNKGGVGTSSIRAFHEVLSAGFGASATAISSSTRRSIASAAAPSSSTTALPDSVDSAVFMPSPQKSRVHAPLGDEDVIIYFQVEQD